MPRVRWKNILSSFTGVCRVGLRLERESEQMIALQITRRRQAQQSWRRWPSPRSRERTKMQAGHFQRWPGPRSSALSLTDFSATGAGSRVGRHRSATDNGDAGRLLGCAGCSQAPLARWWGEFPLEIDRRNGWCRRFDEVSFSWPHNNSASEGRILRGPGRRHACCAWHFAAWAASYLA